MYSYLKKKRKKIISPEICAQLNRKLLKAAALPATL